MRRERDGHNALVKLCRDAIAAHGIPCRVVRSGSPLKRVTYTGRIPDIVGAIPPMGRMFAIEVKTGAGRMDEGQRDFFGAFDAAGALCIEARSLDDLAPLWIAVEHARGLYAWLQTHRDRIQIEPPRSL